MGHYFLNIQYVSSLYKMTSLKLSIYQHKKRTLMITCLENPHHLQDGRYTFYLRPYFLEKNASVKVFLKIIDT